MFILYKTNTKNGRDGFTRIETGPEHPPYGNFCPAPGHHLGFNDLKIIEVAELLRAYSNKTKCFPDFEEALPIRWCEHQYLHHSLLPLPHLHDARGAFRAII